MKLVIQIVKHTIKLGLATITLLWALYLISVPVIGQYRGYGGNTYDDGGGGINWMAWTIFLALVVLGSMSNNNRR